MVPAVNADGIEEIAEPEVVNENMQVMQVMQTRQSDDSVTLSASPVLDSAAAESTELVTQSGNTVMTAGTCVVVDAFLRDFCNANPQDINCQF